MLVAFAVSTVGAVAAPASLRLTSTGEDLAFLSALARDPATEPFLAPGRADPAALQELSTAAPPYGLYVIEAEGGRRLGGLALTAASRTSPICEITRVMVRPELRRKGIALGALRRVCAIALLEHGLHRIETQVYGDNVAAQRLFERAGFTFEGRRRRAYWRRERWLDGVYYGLLAEEL